MYNPMRLTFVNLAGKGSIALCGLLLFSAKTTNAQVIPTTILPVKTVTLFTSGVGYFERIAELTGDVSVPLSFRTTQINDILKSMVLLDEDGKVQPATYAAKDPVNHILQSFSVDVSQNLSQIELLQKVRGVRATVESGKTTITGQIAGVEMRQVAGEDGKPITVPFINLVGDAGIVSVRLDGERNVKLLDERLNKELKEALAVLATGSDEQRRQVTLRFAGNGKRKVSVGYISEAPLWKMSYRLLIGGKEGKSASSYLQGWALVENTSDEDWKGVKLTLVSGRPISFIQDLYQPLYIPRPVVGPDVVASLLPQLHEGAMESSDKKDLDARANAAFKVRTPTGATGPEGAVGPAGPGSSRLRAGGGNVRDFPGVIPRSFATDNSLILNYSSEEAYRNSVQAQASGQSAGELFTYSITAPLHLPRQQAAMIPVLTQDVSTEKVSLYNADLGGKFPLNAIRLKNNTKIHLKGGPITLFDDGVYAGDAKVEDVPPGDSRLVSYAMDQAVEGERKNVSGSFNEVRFSMNRGVLTQTRKERSVTEYKFKSKAEKPRKVLVEHPYNAEFKLLEPAVFAERTQSQYRFAVDLPAGKTETLKVVLERPVSTSYTVLTDDLNTVAFFANSKDASPKLKALLQDVVQRRRKVQELQSQSAQRENEVKSISDDQERIRKNMSALDKSSTLYKRYVTDLDAQETHIQQLRQEANRLRGEAAAAERDLKTYLDGLVFSD